jgi:hypothetical protein
VAQADCTRAGSSHLLARFDGSAGSALLLARRPIVAGAHAPSTGQVLGAGKLCPVVSGFGQNHGGDARDRLQQQSTVVVIGGCEETN